MALYFVRSSDLPRFEAFADELGVNDDVHLLADDAPLPSDDPASVPVLVAENDPPSTEMQGLVNRHVIHLIKANDDELASIRRKFGC